jgi:transposase
MPKRRQRANPPTQPHPRSPSAGHQIGQDHRRALEPDPRAYEDTWLASPPYRQGSTFEESVRGFLVARNEFAPIVLPILEAWRSRRVLAAELGHELAAGARRSEACQILISVPGVGAITATSIATAIDDPDNFKKSRSGGAWASLTTRRYQLGEVDYDGHMFRRADRHLRGVLYEAAPVILTRTSADSALRAWGLKLSTRIGFKRATVAVARNRAVRMLPMPKSDEMFDRNVGVAA